MKEELSFEIVKLFKILLVVIFFQEIKKGFFKGFWKTLLSILNTYKKIIGFYLIIVIFIMNFIDEPVVTFWQTKAFQMKRFYYPGIFGNLLGNGEYIYSAMIVVILVAKIFNKEEIRKKFSLAMTTSIVAGIANSFVKLVFRRNRPDIYSPNAFKYKGYLIDISENLKNIKGDYSMPSGHTTVSTAAFITLFFLTKNKYLKFFYMILPFVTAFGRTYFSKHWVSDVSISLLIGTVFSLVIVSLYDKHKESI